ncbi:hypothetical protein FOZ60_002400 [Perkinsus olseni]|uniref:Uncharacterized protein n=1 Tax=Perkinsus olseni TaxID=32597 RepID=A0A7J6NZ61_PEROL|nr:hypothetical protein FOZ60_002400 [Perkinsus olseni]
MPSYPPAFTSIVMFSILLVQRCGAPSALQQHHQPQDPDTLWDVYPEVLDLTYCKSIDLDDAPMKLFAIGFSSHVFFNRAELDVVMDFGSGKRHYYSGFLNVSMSSAGEVRFRPLERYDAFFKTIDARLKKNNFDLLGRPRIKILRDFIQIDFGDTGFMGIPDDQAVPLQSVGDLYNWLDGCPVNQ